MRQPGGDPRLVVTVDDARRDVAGERPARVGLSVLGEGHAAGSVPNDAASGL